MRSLLLLLALLVAAPAWAANDWGNGEAYTAGCQPGSTIGGSGSICLDLPSTASTSTVWVFNVTGGSALACLKTDFDQSGVSATGGSPVTAVVRLLPAGVATTAAYGIVQCATGGCTLTGAEGTSSTDQLACVGLGPGSYSVVFPTAADSPDVGIFSVEGAK